MKGFYIEVTNNLLDPKHRKKIGSAVWEFMWCLDKITRVNPDGVGETNYGNPVNLADMRDDLAITEANISKNIHKLAKAGYLGIQKTQYGIVITVNKAKKRFRKAKSSFVENDKTLLSKTAKLTPDTYIYNKSVTTPADGGVELKKVTKIQEETSIQKLIRHFFELKGWGADPKKNYSTRNIIYSRFVRPARDLLLLCDQNEPEAEACLDKIAAWAKSRELDWGIETVFKRWYELDFLKPKEKKPHYDGCRIFQKTNGGRWYIIRNGEIRELGHWPSKEQITWK